MQYMSPERLNGGGTGYSWPSDVWSAGLIMLECAMGQHPYAAIGETVCLALRLSTCSYGTRWHGTWLHEHVVPRWACRSQLCLAGHTAGVL